MIIAWCDLWQLKVNASKCKVLNLGFHNKFDADQYKYFINGSGLENCRFEKDLGVFISSDLGSSLHCSKISATAFQILGMTLRSFCSRDCTFLLKCYKSRIRPILEYNCEVWSPYYLQDIDKIESVQRKLTKKIYGLFSIPYSERLRICDLEPLELRRMKRDLVLTYKIRHKLIGLNFDSFFSFAPGVSTRGHRDKLFVTQSSTNRKLSFFSTRVVTVWNELPSHVIEAPSLDVFKRRLDMISDSLQSKLRGRDIRVFV